MRARLDSDTESNCQNCGKELFGRTDKRFCNDSCRNEFNRRKKQQEALAANEAIPEILRIIKRNYEILLNIGPLEPDTEIYFQLPNPRLKEFDFRFYTSVKDYGHLRYYFCFERGWRKSGDIFYVKEDLQQAKI